jgi:hypothetical protein
VPWTSIRHTHHAGDRPARLWRADRAHGGNRHPADIAMVPGKNRRQAGKTHE